ncbi:MAG: hypothetical protein JWR07_3731, partial [Nevskia sp.]|nr:hypothetical protein [Nevskia sp.]
MNKVMFGAVVVGTLALCACGGGASDSTANAGSGAPAPALESLGHIRISVSGLGTPTPIATAENLGQTGPATVNGPQAHALTTEPCFLQIQNTPVSSGAFNANAAQYASFTFKVRNAQGVSGNGCTANTAYGTLSNITLMGLVEPGLAIDGTPFISLQEFDGSKELDGVAPT